MKSAHRVRIALIAAFAIAASMPLAADDVDLYYAFDTIGWQGNSTAITGGTFDGVSFTSSFWPGINAVNFTNSGLWMKYDVSCTIPTYLDFLAPGIFVGYGDPSKGADADAQGAFATDIYFGRVVMGGAFPIGTTLLGFGVNLAPSFVTLQRSSIDRGSDMLVDLGATATWAVTIPLPFGSEDFLESVRINPSFTLNAFFATGYDFDHYGTGYLIELDSYVKLWKIVSANIYMAYDMRVYPDPRENESEIAKSMNNFVFRVGFAFHDIPFFGSQLGDNSL